jgi:tetratricopeptide (TPR) repeat protein
LDLELVEVNHQIALENIRKRFKAKRKAERDKEIADEKAAKLKELQTLEELEKARREGRLDEIQRQIDAEAEAVEKGNEDALKTSQELIEKEFDEREEALKRAAQFRLDNEELTADEILTIEQQLQNDLKNLEDEELQRIKDLNANRIKEEEKTLASILNKNKKFIDDVGREILAQNRKEDQEDIEKIDTEIKRLEKSIETQEELAKNGNDNIAEAERAALVKAQLERKRELKKQADIEEAIQLSLAFINNYSERSKTNPDTALVLALRDIGLAKGVATGIRTVAGFIDGTENVADSLGKANRPGEDGYDIRVDGRERIVNPEDNKLMGSIKNHDLAKLAYNYRTGKLAMNAHQFAEVGATNNINTVQYNFRPIVDEMSRQTKQIGQDLKRYQSTVTTNYNEQGEAVRTIIRDHERLTTIFKQRTRGPI